MQKAPAMNGASNVNVNPAINLKVKWSNEWKGNESSSLHTDALLLTCTIGLMEFGLVSVIHCSCPRLVATKLKPRKS